MSRKTQKNRFCRHSKRKCSSLRKRSPSGTGRQSRLHDLRKVRSFTPWKLNYDDDTEKKGLGTPATRAGIIEKLVRIGFLKRTGDKKTKTLAPTEKGTFLVSILPEELKSVSMTADWEKKLLAIERGELLPDAFMAEIGAFTEMLVKTQKEKPRTAIPLERKGESVRQRKTAGRSRKRSGT